MGEPQRFVAWRRALDTAEALGEGGDLRAASEAARTIRDAARAMREAIARGAPDDHAWTECTLAMTRATTLLERFGRRMSPARGTSRSQ